MERYSTDTTVFIVATIVKGIGQTFDLVNHLDGMGFGLQLVEFNL